MQITEGVGEVLKNLEMILIEEVVALREAKKKGAVLSLEDIAIGYLNPSCGAGQELSAHEHAVGLACMVAVALDWLSNQEVVA